MNIPMIPPVFDKLEPPAVWRHFATLCALPRSSKHEQAAVTYLSAWAAARGYTPRTDTAGNLLIERPARAGAAPRPTAILQGHLDMVCQQNTGSTHNFLHDPIVPVLADGWLKATDTTLGADNGIGVALALAALEDEALADLPLKVLLTVDEEAGMGGARALTADFLQGDYLLNLDTEEWGNFYIGCAGGIDVLVDLPLPHVAADPAFTTWTLEVAGLRGGHSGIDVQRGRAHAIICLGQLLADLADAVDLRLVDIAGGTARNALPREASATLLLPPACAAACAEAVAAWQELARTRFATSDPDLRIVLTPQLQASARHITAASQAALLAFITSVPNGVRSFSAELPEVVETSSNLGIIDSDDGTCRLSFLVRSLNDAGIRTLADAIGGHARTCGATVQEEGFYSGWQPQPESPLLARARAIYTKEFPEAPAAAVQIIHAGLECGLIGGVRPDLPMLSFGPDIVGAHAPGEAVEIASVAHCQRLLNALLLAL
jgi:dipeptidase D